MHTRERAGDALLRTMLVKSIRTVATLIDVNFHVITKAWFPLVITISRYWDSYNYCDSQDSQVHTHRKNRRRVGCLGQYLQSRNDLDSSDQKSPTVWDFWDELSVPIGRKSPRRRNIVKIPDSYDS